jgi:glutamate-1-semialdehyde 2,1-aminomutase
MEPGRGRSRPPWRDASGAGDLWRLCQAVYMATIPTWLGGVGGAAIPTSGAVGGCGAQRPAAGLFYRKSVPAACPNKHRPCLAMARNFRSLVRGAMRRAACDAPPRAPCPAAAAAAATVYAVGGRTTSPPIAAADNTTQRRVHRHRAEPSHSYEPGPATPQPPSPAISRVHPGCCRRAAKVGPSRAMTIGGVTTSVAPELFNAFAQSRPAAQQLWRRAQAVLGGGAGHDLRLFAPVPMYISRGQGCRKWCVDGHEYVDFLCGNGSLLLGHCHPRVVEAVAQAASAGTHFGQDSPLTLEWAEKIQELVPCAERVRFTNSGTEATLLALRMCRAATGKEKMLRFDGHFHGWHDGVIHGFHPPFDAAGSLGVPASVHSQQLGVVDNDLDVLSEALRAHSHEIAACIIEPTGGSWGRVPLDTGFLAGVRELTTKHGVPLIFDEVVSGFRYAPGGAQERYSVTPDLACVAKIVAGGMAGGAVVGSAQLMELFDFTGEPHHDRHERVVHFGTFNGAPVAAAAGLALMHEVQHESVSVINGCVQPRVEPG